MCKASIIIPAYNASAYVGRTIESILGQTFQDFECIVLDDGSTDDTLAVIAQYADPRIRVIKLTNSGGPAKPRNEGLKAARGDYIFMFDSDDIMHPKKLELSVAALEEHQHADLLFTNFSSIDEQGHIIKEDFLAEYDTLWNLLGGKPEAAAASFIAAADLYAALVHINFIGTSSVVLRKRALSSRDIFNPQLKNSDDRLFWISFAKTHNAVYLNERLHQYRIQSNSISNQGFVRRGPSKVLALETAYADCEKPELKAVLKRQIAYDYASLAYAYKLKGMFADQVASARKSLGLQWSLRAFKLLVHGLIKSVAK